MEITTTTEEALSLLRIEVRPGDGGVDMRAAYKALLATAARSGMRRLLLDYSNMTVDITVEDFLDIRRRKRLFEALHAIKIAVILREELETTMILMAAMRTFGVRVAAFTDNDRALAWLLYEDGLARRTQSGAADAPRKARPSA
jgi:hypothetical protein